MENNKIKESISNAIATHFVHYMQNEKPSKLSQICSLYQSKTSKAMENISYKGRLLTKKIFGVRVKCWSKNHLLQGVTSNLICLAEIILLVAFQDEYVFGLLIQQLVQDNHHHFEKILGALGEWKKIGVSATDIRPMLIDVVIKINALRDQDTLFNILTNFPIAGQIFSLLLQTILLRFPPDLLTTDNIYQILSEYFSINILTQYANSIHSISSLSQNQWRFGQKSRVYLFPEYNLFISTIDDQEFCRGRYCSSQEEFGQKQHELFGSVSQYIGSCRESKIKEIKEERESEDQEKSDIIKGFDLDLGLSNSGLITGSQLDSAYFNPDTPEFTQILDSARFQKTIDFSAAIRLAEKGKIPQLIIEEDQISTPQSTPQSEIIKNKLNLGKDNNQIAKLFFGEEKLNDSFHFEDEHNKKLNAKYPKPQTSIKPAQKLQQSIENSKARPRSPPSFTKNYKIYDHDSFQDAEQVDELPINLAFPTITKPLSKPTTPTTPTSPTSPTTAPTQPCQPPHPHPHPHPYPYPYLSPPLQKIKQLSNMSVKQSHNFHPQENIQFHTVSKRKNSGRKYSVNQAILRRDFDPHHRNHVHYSNYFGRADPDNGRKDQSQFLQNATTVKQDTIGLTTTNNNGRKCLKIISKAVNVEITISQMTKKQKKKQQIYFGKSKSKSKSRSRTPLGSMRIQIDKLTINDSKSINAAKAKRNSQDPYLSYQCKLENCQSVRTLGKNLGSDQSRGNTNHDHILKSMNYKMSPRSHKVSKFPQFLKNLKDRKAPQEKPHKPQGRASVKILKTEHHPNFPTKLPCPKQQQKHQQPVFIPQPSPTNFPKPPQSQKQLKSDPSIKRLQIPKSKISSTEQSHPQPYNIPSLTNTESTLTHPCSISSLQESQVHWQQIDSMSSFHPVQNQFSHRPEINPFSPSHLYNPYSTPAKKMWEFQQNSKQGSPTGNPMLWCQSVYLQDKERERVKNLQNSKMFSIKSQTTFGSKKPFKH